MRIAILWFRRDLRLEDNPITQIDGYDVVLPIFIVDPWFFSWREVGRARTTFMFESLEALNAALETKHNGLHVFHGNPLGVLQGIIRNLSDNAAIIDIFFNRDIQTEYGLQRDIDIKHLVSHYSHVSLIEKEPSFMVGQDYEMGQWARDWYSYNHQELYICCQELPAISKEIALPFEVSFEELKRLYPSFWRNTGDFKGGEDQAQSNLQSFIDHRHHGYHWKLSRPWHAQQGSTSHLSPYIMFGCISPRQAYQSAYKQNQMYKTSDDPLAKKHRFALKAFIDRLRWRDSFTQRLMTMPWLTWKNRFSEFDSIYTYEELSPEKKQLYQAWQNGETGFALVDASMRQLKEMGWMNFRMRAMCATFLTINLGISWHWGAQHYMNYLVDGDMAIDSWQWQMQSGITNPLSKTFRIYNPTKNIRTKDPNLKFIHHWVPELRKATIDQIISHESPDSIGVSEISGYQKPIINFADTRRKQGKVVSDLRAQVRKRIQEKYNLEDAKESRAIKKAVTKYMDKKNQSYHSIKNRTEDLFVDS